MRSGELRRSLSLTVTVADELTTSKAGVKQFDATMKFNP